SDELLQSKQLQSWRVGKPYMEFQYVLINRDDSQLHQFMQRNLDTLYRPYEEKIRQLKRSILERRVALDQKKSSADEFFAGTYSDVLDSVIWVWEAELTSTANANYTLVAEIYSLEMPLRKTYNDTDEALRRSDTPYRVRMAKLAQLEQDQGAPRKNL